MPPPAFGLARTPAVKHGRGIPAQRGRRVAANAEPVDFYDAAARIGTGNRVADDRHPHQGATVEDGAMEPPGSRYAAMRVVLRDEPARLTGADGTELELPVENQPSATVIRDAA